MTPSRDQIIAIARHLAPIFVPMPSSGLPGMCKDVSALVCAIIEQESNFDPWAFRYEPGFYELYIKPRAAKLGATEAMMRSSSWGVMQVMGESAREADYLEALPKLCDPEVGITVGCSVLKNKLALAKGDAVKALQFWNGGANPNYASEVLARVGKFTQEAN